MKYYSAMFYERLFEIKNKKCSRNKKYKSKNWRTKMFVKYHSAMFYERFFEIKNKKVYEILFCNVPQKIL